MERPWRTILILLAALILASAFFCGLTLILFGDDLRDLAEDTYFQAILALRTDELNTPLGTNTDPIRFTIFSGDTAASIGQRLERLGLISDAELFGIYARVQGIDAQLEAGTYFLNIAMSMSEMANALTDSRFSQITFRILPGWRIEEVAEAISANRFFAFTGDDFLAVIGRGAELPTDFAWAFGIPEGMSLEGFLLPETYVLPADVTPLTLRDILLTAFDSAITEQMRLDATEQGFSIYEMVTLASIIERETLHDDENPRVSSAYRNRLATPGWRLDADPTVQYEHPNVGPGNWWPRITRADYRGVISPYNTYINPGLPPGPIANPSLSAISAAIYPADTPYFFFRADCRNDGYHDFAITYEEHLANGC